MLPSVILLFLVRHVAEDLAPGFGAAAAVTLGLGTIVLPFATLFFSHALSTLLDIAAFVLLWRERRGKPGLLALAAAGLAAGFAVSTEFPNVLFAGALGLYAVSRPPLFRRALVYGAGVAIGLLPVAVYDWLVFGSPLSLPYAHNVENDAGIFGLLGPSVKSLAVILLSPVGLLVLTPCGRCRRGGIILLYRRGARFDALFIAVVCAAFLLYDTAYWERLGGGSPGHVSSCRSFHCWQS